MKTELDGLIWLDTKKLREFGMLNENSTRSLTWTDTWGSKSRIMIAINTYARRARVWYTATDKFTEEKTDCDYYIILDDTRCNYGGQRWWFFCPIPGCARRVRKLYMKDSYFGCRTCHNLCYGSQNENRRSMLYGLFSGHDKAEELLESIRTPYYKGKPTRKMQRYMKLSRKGPTDEEYLRLLEKMLDGEVK